MSFKISTLLNKGWIIFGYIIIIINWNNIINMHKYNGKSSWNLLTINNTIGMNINNKIYCIKIYFIWSIINIFLLCLLKPYFSSNTNEYYYNHGKSNNVSPNINTYTNNIDWIFFKENKYNYFWIIPFSIYTQIKFKILKCNIKIFKINLYVSF